MFICSIHKRICEFQHLSTLREPTGGILYIVFIFRRVRWISGIHHKMQKMCLFLGEPFQWWCPSRHIHRSLLCSAHRSHLYFSIFDLYFSSVSVFVPLYDLYVVIKKATYKLIHNDKSMRHRKAYSKCCLRAELQLIRLLCFRKTNG